MHEPQISLLIVARDASKVIVSTLRMAIEQTLEPAHFEVIVIIDPATRDDTLRRCRAFAGQHSDWYIDCALGPSPSLAAGWNAAIARARAPRILRWDAHGQYPRDFLANSLACMIDGDHAIVGGQCRPTLPPHAGEHSLARAIWIAESSPWVAIASFRKIRRAGPVPSLARALYDRRIFERLGGFRVFDHGCEDIEAHARMRAAGYEFHYDPRIVSGHHTRIRLSGLDRQKFRNGTATTALAATYPGCLRWPHLTPMLWLSGLSLLGTIDLVGSSLGVAGTGGLLAVALAMNYAAILIGLGRSARGEPLRLRCLAAFIVIRVHVAFGLGSWYGLLRKRRSSTPLPAISPRRARDIPPCSRR